MHSSLGGAVLQRVDVWVDFLQQFPKFMQSQPWIKIYILKRMERIFTFLSNPHPIHRNPKPSFLLGVKSFQLHPSHFLHHIQPKKHDAQKKTRTIQKSSNKKEYQSHHPKKKKKKHPNKNNTKQIIRKTHKNIPQNIIPNKSSHHSCWCKKNPAHHGSPPGMFLKNPVNKEINYLFLNWWVCPPYIWTINGITISPQAPPTWGMSGIARELGTGVPKASTSCANVTGCFFFVKKKQRWWDVLCGWLGCNLFGVCVLCCFFSVNVFLLGNVGGYFWCWISFWVNMFGWTFWELFGVFSFGGGWCIGWDIKGTCFSTKDLDPWLLVHIAAYIFW